MVDFYTILKTCFSKATPVFIPAQHCLCCRTPVNRSLALCEACEADLPWQPPSCSHCGLWRAEVVSQRRLNNDDNPQFTCMNCQHLPPPFDYCSSVFAYESPISTMIKRFKEHAGFHEARCLGDLLHASFRQSYVEQECAAPDFLLPVPLHSARLRKRGFNQSAMLANSISKRSAIPVLWHACNRRGSTHTQRGLNAAERRENMRSVFVAGSQITQISRRHVAIIDDVVTTTATVSAMADILKSHGAARIDVWCVARANSF
jgi:ComF family protein